MKNNKFKYTKIRNNDNILSYIEDILFKIKSKLSKSNGIQRIRTTYVHSTRYTSNDKKNNITNPLSYYDCRFYGSSGGTMALDKVCHKRKRE